MRVALVCIAKNEENYIQEWIDYHIKLGFDKIFIYQNDWRWTGETENVIKFELDGIDRQRTAYNHFLKTFNNDYDWVGFFDVDEFLVLKKHNNIKSFIQDYSDYNSIGINWVFFGSNGHTEINEEYSVIKRFTKRKNTVDQHIKCLVKILPEVVMDIHNSNMSWVDTEKRKSFGPFNPFGDNNVAQINHYFCKTKEEFQLKCDRGRADSPIYRRTIDEYENHNFNEIEDLTAYNFFYK